MSSNSWRNLKVSEIGKVITGKTPKTAITEYYGGSTPFLTPSDNMDSKFVSSTSRTLSDSGLQSVRNCLLSPNSISVSCIGSDLGKVVLNRVPTVTNQQINSILPNKNFDPDFIYYSMVILGKKLNYLSKTSTAVPIINKSTFSSFSILIPPLEEQKAIALVLSTLDDKIEVNNRINKTLEDMAQAIFKRWFVDFEFSNEDGEPYKSSGGEMVESELGMIPKGWRVGIFSDLITFQNGYPFKSNELESEFKTNYFHVFKMGNIKKGGGLKQDGTKSYYPKEKAGNLGRFVLKKGDLLMSMTDMKSNVAILGHTALMSEDNKYIVNQRVGLIRSKTDGMYPYLYVLTNSYDFIHDLRSRANSGVQVNLSTKGITESKIIIPEENVLKKYNEMAKNLYEQYFNLYKENEILNDFKNLLLPKLMSGEIRVPIEEL